MCRFMLNLKQAGNDQSGFEPDTTTNQRSTLHFTFRSDAFVGNLGESLNLEDEDNQVDIEFEDSATPIEGGGSRASIA